MQGDTNVSDIIADLRAEHKKLLDHLAKAKELGCFTKEARDVIYGIEKEFEDHLVREDEHLYKALRRIAKADTKTKSLLESFARELEMVTSDVVNFFEAHKKDSSHEHFEKDIVHLIASVEARILKEEHVLYPLLAKHAAA